VGGIVGGVKLDEWLGTEPLLTLLGMVLGLAAAFWGGYFLLMDVLGQRNQVKDDDEA
jgi:F0F1-type ATP synthase assembly protein I